MEQAIGKCKIFLKPNYSIDFTKENSIRTMLGFDSVIINNAVNISSQMINVILTKKYLLNVM